MGNLNFDLLYCIIIGTIGHQVAKVLLSISKPLETNEYVTKNSFTFANNIRSIRAVIFGWVSI